MTVVNKPNPRWGGKFRVLKLTYRSGKEFFIAQRWVAGAWADVGGFDSQSSAMGEIEKYIGNEVVSSEVVAE